MIAIIDYEMGNVKSIQNMLKKIGVESIITSDIEKINSAKKYILPGVGSFDEGMQNIRKNEELLKTLKKNVLVDKKPILGICLGMQLLTNSSEEGIQNGLGWVDASCHKFKFKDNSLTVPHMGWNKIFFERDSKLFRGLEDNRFYFVHSFFVKCNNIRNMYAQSTYGSNFCCSLNESNIYGVQFHPEKSHKFGMKLLKNFSEI